MYIGCTIVGFILYNTVAKAYQKAYGCTKHSAVTSQLITSPLLKHLTTNLFRFAHEKIICRLVCAMLVENR